MYSILFDSTIFFGAQIIALSF